MLLLLCRLCLSSKECQFALSSVHLGISAVALSQLTGAGIHLWTRVEPISKRCTHQMKTAPAYPAGTVPDASPWPSSALPAPLPASPDPFLRAADTGKETSSGDRRHSDDRGLEEMTSGLWHNARGPQPTCF